MDRLPALIALAAVVTGCPDPSRPPPHLERFNAVAAEPKTTASTNMAGFCDVQATDGKPRSFRYPELAAPAPAATAAGRPRWVNVWATWCKPCVEELPMLLRWQAKLEKEGAPFDLVLLSLDEDDDAIRRFRAQHPGTPPSLRIKDPDRAPPWVAATLGLEKTSAIPIHVFVNARGQIRCARSGGVGRDHLSVVQSLLGGG